MMRALVLLLCVVAMHGQPLRELAAQRSIYFGAAVDPSRFVDAAYKETLGREFSQAEPENAMKFGPIHPGASRYDFVQADAIVDFAGTRGMVVRGHTLVWHQQNASWITSLDAVALGKALHDHIATVVGRYAGKVYAWDVVNEAFNDNGTLRSSVWSDTPGIGLAGTAYIEQAFRWAREADPRARLFYNDYSAEGVNAKSDAIYKMAQDFKARGVPIDGIGMQMHLTSSTPSLASIEANMKRLTDLGLEVQFTELDVRLVVDSSGAATAAGLAAQAKIYGDIVALCLKFTRCTAVQTWGLTDKYSWIPGSFPGFGAALPFDAAYGPKPARDSIAAAMQNAPAVISAEGFVNAASYAGGAVAPGEIVVLFGSTYGPAEIAYAPNIGGVRLLFDGVEAPLLYAKAGQVGAVVPFGVAGKTSVAVVYEYHGVASNAVTLPVRSVLPGIFTLDSSGAGPGAILNGTTFRVISKENPARAGDYLAIYGTGLGAGSAAVTATIGGVDAPVLYAGAAPGLIAGASQINVQVPAGVAAGEQAIVVTVSGVATQAGVTVNVQ
jgi:endo-1,4-beta-xylanase